MKTAQLVDALKANGEEHLYDQIVHVVEDADENPPVIFEWHDVNDFLEVIRTAQLRTQAGADPLPPCPLELPDRLTVDGFKATVLLYTRDEVALMPLGTSCLPCSMVGSLRACGTLTALDANPWTRHVRALGPQSPAPIASVYVPRQPCSETLDNVLSHEHFPNSLWG